MAGQVPNDIRDRLITEYRNRICERLGVVPFTHQAQWWAASDGLMLLDHPDESGIAVQLPDGTTEKRGYANRPGGRARVIADLGSFKIGKSYGAGIWLAGFAAVPGAKVQLVGNEYSMCEPEFNYICDILLSEHNGAPPEFSAKHYQNRPNDGRMWLELNNGAKFEAKSWERKDSLKGKEVDAYCFCEAYQLPGIECFNANSQNLRARQGYALFPTTPDRPWIQELHNAAHCGLPEFREWHCTCGVPSSVNPFTYSEEARRRDEKMMTREKFAIHHMGQLGDYVGKVFNYSKGESTFNANSHPELFSASVTGAGNREDLRVPDGWDIVSAVDTGTYYTAVSVAFSPDGTAFVLEEVPNYRYVMGVPERDEAVTIPTWVRQLERARQRVGGRPVFWADRNTQFKLELRAYGIGLLPSPLPLEARTEITREYFQHGRVYLAPWLEVLPFELENAAWPEEASLSGKFQRVKDRDHTLDCLEHVLSRRPYGKPAKKDKKYPTWVENWMGRPKKLPQTKNPHLGSQ